VSQNTPKPSSKTAAAQRPVFSLERIRLLKQELLRRNGSERLSTIRKGETIVREGDEISGSPALVVVNGKLVECITRHVSGRGRQQITLCEVTPGAITNVQALVRAYAQQPALLTITAVEDTEVIELYADGLRNLGQFGQMLDLLFRKSMQMADELHGLRMVESELEETKTHLAEATFDLKIASDESQKRLEELKAIDKKLIASAAEMGRLAGLAWRRNERAEARTETNRVIIHAPRKARATLRTTQGYEELRGPVSHAEPQIPHGDAGVLTRIGVPTKAPPPHKK